MSLPETSNSDLDLQKKCFEKQDGRYHVERRLNTEFKRINSLLRLDLDLKVIWAPNAKKDLSGEVMGNNILIYEPDEEEVIKILRHEVMDYVVCQAIKPYEEITNILMKKINDDAYRKKERIIDAITQLLK